MFRIGRMIRSAKMNAITPPKLIPPFQRTAASGILPTEQTKDKSDTIGPTSGPHKVAATGCELRKNVFQKSCGTQAASAPASKSPTTMAFHASFDPFVRLLPRLAYQLGREKKSEEHRDQNYHHQPTRKFSERKLPAHQHNENDAQFC